MTKYIYEHKGWPDFCWDAGRLQESLGKTHRLQERLLARMSALGFELREEAMLQSLTQEVIKSSEIEGEHLDKAKVRSSIARRLGMDIGALAPSDRNTDGVVEMMLDATQNFMEPLTGGRLFGWHASLFPAGYSGMHKIRIGEWRNDANGPMQVVSGRIGREHVHFQAPPAAAVEGEMQAFLQWFNTYDGVDLLLRAGIAHFWFVTIHPFEDGNGRIARAIADMALAHSEKTPQRFYSMSAQIRDEREAYYVQLEQAQKGGLNITDWLDWFLGCLGRACAGADGVLAGTLRKAHFWDVHKEDDINPRQRLVLNRLLDGFEGKLTSSKWAALCKCSQDTAHRDIEGLLRQNILAKAPGGGRSTSYVLIQMDRCGMAGRIYSN